MIYLLCCHVFALGFAGLHEVHVVLQQRGVEHAHYAVFVTHIGHGEHVLERYGLSAYEVCPGFYAHECYILGAVLPDGFLEYVEVEVALERVVALGFQAFAVDYFYNFASAARYVGFGRGEVEVHDSHRTGLHECFGQNVLAGSSLMGGQQIFGSEYLLDCATQAVECFASRV